MPVAEEESNGDADAIRRLSPSLSASISPELLGPGEAAAALAPLAHVVLPSVAFAGAQLAWAVQIGHATAHFRFLGLRDDLVSLAWLAGPVTGIVMQPLSGVMSDRSVSRHGRRRPFILLGAVLAALSVLVFSRAADIAAMLNDPVDARGGGGSRTALLIALIAFWTLDSSLNFLQAPSRALLADLAAPPQLPLGNALFALATGLGKATGYLLGALGDLRAVASVAAALVLLLALAPVLLLRERAALPPASGIRASARAEICGLLRATGVALRGLPRAARRAFVVQSLSFLAIFLFFVYYADWVGASVLRGDASAAPGSPPRLRFARGVRLANRAMLAMSVLCMLLAPALPALQRAFGTRHVWLLSLALFGAAMLAAPLRPGQTGAAAVACAAAPALTCGFSVPWAIAAHALRGPLAARRGLYLGVFNLAQAAPGIVGSVLGGLVVWLAAGSLAVVLAVAGCVALAAAVAVLFVEVPEENDEYALLRAAGKKQDAAA